jgi:predicted lipoprotein with Yx(FWY)xxD motif
MKRTILAAAILAISAVGSFAAEPAMMADSSAGKVYVDGKGMTLYTFDQDTTGTSNCYDKCATAWPPFFAKAGVKDDGEWTVVTRKDGTLMWAYEGKPLYTFIKDKKPGDVTGDNVGGVWHVAN